MTRRLSVIVTCEHATHHVPARYRRLFPDPHVLLTHRGYDPGAIALARKLANAAQAPLHAGTMSRLLIELNRTVGHQQFFSEFSRTLSDDDRNALIEQIYRPYRKAVEDEIEEAMKDGPVLHLSVHSFTPELKGVVRKTDIGLLFDPSRDFERKICHAWRNLLRAQASGLGTHFNLPYRGTSDGFTVALRQRHPQHYAGIEIEVNQKFVFGPPPVWRNMRKVIADSLEKLLEQMRGER